MPNTASLIYVPALRLKQGEYRGLQRLAPDIADVIRPRLIVPPPKERDPESKRVLTMDEIVHETGRRIADHWPLREAFLEPSFLFSEFGEAESEIWLPRMFEVAQRADAKLIPVATVKDLIGPRSGAFSQVLAEACTTKLALRIVSGEIDADLQTHVDHALSSLRLTPEDCTVLADFCDADFSNPAIVVDIAQAALEDLQAIGNWREVVFQGSNYPEFNPAEPDSYIYVPRNEWLAWQDATKFDANTSEHLIFGDYGADCAKIEFRSGGGRPIRHYRYTTPDSWLVVRGKVDQKDDVVMKEVCETVLDSGTFAGREFSSADDYIFRTAKGRAGPGNGTVWREINTAHHITRVVRDIGRIKGLEFADVKASDPPEQMTIFDGAMRQDT